MRKIMLFERKEKQGGQSLVEVVVAAGVVMMVLVGVVAVIVITLQRNRFAKEMSVGTRLAQEGLEWVREQREVWGWSHLQQEIGDGRSYCLNEIPQEGMVLGQNCSNDLLGIYRRELEIRTQGNEMEVTINVYWDGADDADEDREVVSLRTSLYDWR